MAYELDLMDWPNNPVSEKIRDTFYPIKTITVSVPDSPVASGYMLWIRYDAGMDIRRPPYGYARGKGKWMVQSGRFVYLSSRPCCAGGATAVD